MKKANKKGRKALLLIVFLVSLSVFLFSSYRLYKEWRRYHDAAVEYSEIAEGAKVPIRKDDETLPAQTKETAEQTKEASETDPSESEESEPEDNLPSLALPEYYIDFHYLKNINSDVVGWITIPGTRVDYPIAHGTDNDYYLHYNLKGVLNWIGCPFIDYRLQGDFSERATYVYGHDLNDGAMFPDIKKYREESFYLENPYFYIYTQDSTLVYQVFSAHTASKSDGYAFRFDFAGDEDFEEYIEYLKSIAYYNTNVSVAADSKTVSLVTCEKDKEYRFVLNGVLIQEIREAH